MADGELTMFGKAYDTVGSTNKNLVLLTRGDLKIRWGNKYIDLIKNGKINVDVELIQKVSDVSEIVKDGIYLIEKEEGNEIWLSVGGTTINIFGEISDNYVAFVKEQDIDVDNKFRALSNIGFYYESMEKAKEKQIKKGLVFILDLNKLYYVEEGEFKEYTLTQTTEIPSPLKLKNITINGEDEYITGNTGLYFSIVNDIYMLLLNDTITLQKLLVTNNTISSEDFQSGQSGFGIYNDDKDYIGEFDVIKVRKSIIYDEVLDVTYEQLRELMEGHKLYPRKLYRIIDFFNEWDCYYYNLTSEQSALTTKVYEYPAGIQFYFPIVVTAASTNTLEKEGYYCENRKWIIEYDPTFNHFLCEIEGTVNGEARKVPIYARGRITKLTDEYGNSANYDFKHRLFKATLSSDDRKTWLYTYNKVRNATTTNPEKALSWEYIHNNWDASADGNITNNIVNLPEPELESYTLNGSTVLKVKLSEDYFIFDCTTNQPYGNNIKHSKGKFNVTGPFYNNTFELLISADAMTFSLDFHDNVFQGVKDCILNAPMQFNTFDRNLVNVAFRCDTMKNNHITGVIYTNNSRSTYPIEATTFNNNTINNINMSSITCYGCDIANNSIHNINGCTILNSHLTDITMKDITGSGSYSDNPSDTIDGSSGGNIVPGGDPVNPGGDTPVNPGGNDPVNPSDSVTIITSEPSTTAVNDIMHGTHTNADPLANTSGSSQVIGYIEDTVSSSYGTPTIYGVYISENASMLSSVSVVPSSTSGHSYDIVGNITANSTTSTKKVHVWVQFADANQLGYVSVYQAAGSGSSGGDTPTGDTDVDEYLNTFKSSSLSSTSLSNEKYSLLSTAMDKLDTFESSVMSDNMFVDDVLTLPSGNSAETRNARRGWFMALLLTALYPIKNSAANNDILSDAMSTWGISQSTNTNTYSVSTYEAKYKGLLQGSIAFSYLFSDSSFVNSFASHTSYSYLGSDGDLGPESRANAPAGQYFFPYPPTNDINATTGLMGRDENAFLLGKNTLRSTSRGTTALNDVTTTLTYFLNILQTATGKNNGSGNAYTFMHDTQWDGKRTVNNIKNTPSFWRSRPAWENNDTSVDQDTYNLNFGENGEAIGASTSDTTSYPSGHTGYFWNTAYCFMAIGGLSNSAIVNLFARAYQYSESRVVLGAHWQMCVEMGRIAAACSFATLCGNTKFIEELLAALS